MDKSAKHGETTQMGPNGEFLRHPRRWVILLNLNHAEIIFDRLQFHFGTKAFVFLLFLSNTETRSNAHHSRGGLMDIFCHCCTSVRMWFLHAIKCSGWCITTATSLARDYLFPSIDEWIHNRAQPPYCMHVCVIITVSVWPWWKIITLSCTLDTIHVLSIFWIIVIYFYYRCQCLDLFPIRRGIYHTSNLHSLPAERRKERRGERDAQLKLQRRERNRQK